MKTTALVLLALSASDVATAIKFIAGPEGWAQSLGFNSTDQPWDDIKFPPTVMRALAPKRQQMNSRVPTVPNSKTVKLRYGPYTVPAPMV
jgi:hypothetical protein